MNERVKLFLLASVVAGTCGLTAFSLYQNSPGNVYAATPIGTYSNGDNVVLLNNTALKDIPLQSYTVGGNDHYRKFRIELEGDKYISGALIYFSNFGSFEVGSTLGDDISISNDAYGGDSPYSIACFFSVHGIHNYFFGSSMNRNMVKSMKVEEDNLPQLAAKWSEEIKGDFYTDFIEKETYDNLVGTKYENVYGGYNNKALSVDHLSSTGSVYNLYSSIGENIDVIGFSIRGTLIYNQTYTFSIPEIEFHYGC